MTIHRASERASDRPSTPQAYQCKITESTGVATQMQLKAFYIWKEITWPLGLLERKNTLFFMFTLTWITEKELKRVIENKGDEFRRKKNMEIQSGGEKMRNASGQQGEK